MNCARKRRLQPGKVLYVLTVILLSTFCQPIIGDRLYETLPSPHFGEDSTERFGEIPRKTEQEGSFTATHGLDFIGRATAQINHLDTSDNKASILTESPPLPNLTVDPEPETDIPPASPRAFPADLFSIEDCRRGWVILHIVGMTYMFISLLIVCNEFFVPSLEVITDKLAISADVTGAIFMAAGISSLKIFATIRELFLTHRHASASMIVGPSVFNVVFVIGLCALFSRKVLHLNWWPLLRDLCFYILFLSSFIKFCLDNAIEWWENIFMVINYIFYAIFMKHNSKIERAFKSRCCHKDSVENIYAEEPENVCRMTEEDGPQDLENAISAKSSDEEDIKTDSMHKRPVDDCQDVNEKKEKEEEEGDRPLSLKWPDTQCKQARYLLLLPIILPLWLTLPDVRNQKSRKFFVLTFLVSILWIAVFSYFMEWWTHQMVETFAIGILDPILNGIAAESSILISTVIVTRKGLGDMAVSSSMGCNIFFITLGLPLPWLLFSAVHGLTWLPVDSSGLVCAMMLLILMLFFFIISMASFKWRMSKVLGFTLLLVYLIFVVLCMVLHYRYITCP